MTYPVNRALLVGLGGQGQTALDAVKARLLEAHGGEIPPVIKFLSIDTTSKDRELTTLGDEDFFSLTVKNVTGYVDQHRDDLVWLDYENIPRSRLKNISTGSGQIRMIGRLGLRYHQKEVLNLIGKSIDQIKNWKATQDPRWEVAPSAPQIIFFGSVAGGTGGGMLLDIACAARLETGSDWKFSAFLLLPGVFAGKVGVDYVEENSFAFLKELDFFMSGQDAIRRGEHGDLFSQKTQDGRRFMYVEPFDSITLIDNEHQHGGATYNEPRELARAIGEVIYAMTGNPMGDAQGNILDNPNNYEESWQGGKRCLYAGLGVAVLRYPTSEVAEYAERTIARRLMTLLSAGQPAEGGPSADPQELADEFQKAQGIRQDHDQSELLDKILAPRPFASQIPKINLKSIDLAQIWLANQGLIEAKRDEHRKAAAQNREALVAQVREALDSEIESIMSSRGYGVASGFVSTLKGSLLSVRDQMTARKDDATERVRRSEATVGGLQEKAGQARHRLIGKLEALKAALGQYGGGLSTLARAQAEKAATSEAIEVCRSLCLRLDELADALSSQHVAAQNLLTLSSRVRKDARATITTTLPFEVLVYPDLDNLDIPSPTAADFYAWLTTTHGEGSLAFWAKPTAEAYERLLEFARYCDAAGQQKGAVTLASIMAQKTDDERDEILKRVHDIAQPLLPVDESKVVDEPSVPSNLYFVAADKQFWTLFDDRELSKRSLVDRLKKLDVQDVQPITLIDPERAYFYRRWGCVPAYALGCFDLLKNKYDETAARQHQWSLHLDRRWREVLPALEPDSGADENLWVWALAVSDVDYLRCVKRSATRYTLQYIWNRDGSKDTKEIKLGTGGLAAARTAFLANKEFVDHCRDHIETAVAGRVDEAQRDLEAYFERLKTIRDSAADGGRKQLLDEEVGAVSVYIANLRR